MCTYMETTYKKGRDNMKVTSISRKAFERLEKMKLSRNIRNTEGVIYDFKHC